MTALRRALKSPMRRRETLWGYIFLAPFIIGFFLWQAGPLLLSLYYSFTEYNLLQPEEWIGPGNYQRMLDDKLFWISLVNTVIYTAMSVGIFLFFSLGGALLLNAKVRGIAAFRVIVYLPSQLPLVASAFIFLWIFEPTFGLANFLLQTIGLEPQQWLFDPVLAKPTLAIMGIWGIGTGIIIFLAGLQSVPEILYDAAKVDGAGTLRQFWHVTLPMVSPVILFCLIISIIASFQVFDLAYIMTDGGPGTETLFYVLYIFRNGFEFFRMGYASALAWVLFLLILGLTFLNFRASGRWVHYEVSAE
jgi:multiple sugar transport system permease protein